MDAVQFRPGGDRGILDDDALWQNGVVTSCRLDALTAPRPSPPLSRNRVEQQTKVPVNDQIRIVQSPDGRHGVVVLRRTPRTYGFDRLLLPGPR
ncbi:MAG: hypothetical protein ACKVZ0_20245 [Gemmatimonadales bacterium]